ncbi:MAG TPA: carboxypeptidase regulatory-like domain-containing protein [Longimicrobiales bacterium]|nr:carboxypeptidase regulatory-like domain-containing protein [Longimicrobiales bacterium]
MRLPRLALAPGLLGGRRKVLVGYREAGGEVTGASDAAGGALAGSGHAMLEGVVFDSVHGRAVAGATVFAAGTSRSASTDSLGRFRLEGLLAGEHTIAFTHPSLDTLGIHPPVRRMRVDSAGLAGVRLGVPARRTVVRVVCGERRRGGDDGIATARVIDGATGAAVAGAHVEFSWPRHLDDGRHSADWQAVRRGSTDAEGVIRACGLPREVPITARATDAARQSDAVVFSLDRFGFARVELVLSSSTGEAAQAVPR